MKKVVIGYAVNDEQVFNTSVLGEALKQMTSKCLTLRYLAKRLNK